MTGIAAWHAYTGAVPGLVSIVFGFAIACGIRFGKAVAAEWRRGLHILADIARTMQAVPEPDFAFLANCLWCANISQDVDDCDCDEACPEVEWCVAGQTMTSWGASGEHPF